MAFLWDNHREVLSPQMRRYIENGQKTSRDEYVAGMRRLDECRALLGSVFDKVDVLLVPCVPGEAPKGLGATGDPSMQAIWTALHTPTMTLPTHRGPNDLPVGIQIGGAALRRRSPVRLRALDLGQDRRAGDGWSAVRDSSHRRAHTASQSAHSQHGLPGQARQ